MGLKRRWIHYQEFYFADMAEKLPNSNATIDNLASLVWQKLAPPKVEFFV